MLLSLESISAIFWSESGFVGSSALMICRIFSLTDSEAIPSPSAVRMLELKKNFSSNTPCGVCAYLLVVTRETVDSCMPMSSATSRRLSGRRCSGPLSKKPRWKRMIDSITRTIVRWRWWIDLISQIADRSFSRTYSRVCLPLPSLFASTSRYAALTRSFGMPSSFSTT